jgi:hypothetical protein
MPSIASFRNWSLANLRLPQFVPLEDAIDEGIKTAAVFSGKTKIASAQL